MARNRRPADVYVPLRSNAKALVAGGGVASVRRRLKTASLLYDRVLLEGGALRIAAGPTGSFAMKQSFDPRQPRTTWDTSAARHAAIGRTFSLAMGPESQPGVPATGAYQPVVQSEATISWDVSLEPFVGELPPSCEWIGFTVPPELPPDRATLMKEWQDRDERNPRLVEALPVGFVRRRVVDDANLDLASGVQMGAALSADLLHQNVMSMRLLDDVEWRFRGFALPILFPHVVDLAWHDIATLRRHRLIVRYREILKDIEDDAFESSDGDIEAAVNGRYQTKLRSAIDSLESLGTLVRHTVCWFGVGTGIGFVTAGVTGPAGPILGAAASTAVGAALEFRQLSKRRRARGWVAMDLALHVTTAPQQT